MEGLEAYMNNLLIRYGFSVASILLVILRIINVNRNHEILFEALLRYRQHCQMTTTVPMVDYDDLDDFWSIVRRFFRFWDWGYEHYLTPYQYQLIKPYIKDKRKEKKK